MKLYIQPNGRAYGWVVVNEHGYEIAFTLTRWGARWAARRIIRRATVDQELVQ